MFEITLTCCFLSLILQYISFAHFCVFIAQYEFYHIKQCKFLPHNNELPNLIEDNYLRNKFSNACAELILLHD